MEFADKKEISRIDKEIDKVGRETKRFVLKAEVQERFRKVEKEIWEELSIKLEKSVFDRKFSDLEVE